jgi:hypothetical protein
MKMSMAIGLLVTLVPLGLALAGNNPQVKVAVHVVPHSSGLDCAGLPAIASCEDITTTCAAAGFDAFPVFFDLTEFKGVGYGLCWPDWEASAAWTQCADEAVGSIARPGDGLYQTWTECRTQRVLVAGWAWIYADGPGIVAVCNHPETHVVEVLDCSLAPDTPTANYSAGVAGTQGDDPCAVSVTSPTTWGAIKGMFE